MGSSLILGVPLQQSGTSFHHPPPATVMKLWTIFLENVNPVTKLLHVPSTNQKLLDATSSPESISRGMEALMFSIYACAIVSMTEKECRKLLGDERDALLLKYQSASQHALLACGILKPSEIIVLQAFVLMLVSLSKVPREGLEVNLGRRHPCKKILTRVLCGHYLVWPSASVKGLVYIEMEHHSDCLHSKQKCDVDFGGILWCLMPAYVHSQSLFAP